MVTISYYQARASKMRSLRRVLPGGARERPVEPELSCA